MFDHVRVTLKPAPELHERREPGGQLIGYVWHQPPPIVVSPSSIHMVIRPDDVVDVVDVAHVDEATLEPWQQDLVDRMWDEHQQRMLRWICFGDPDWEPE